ncbi:unnamed protein product [Urochloa humidicola]
MHLRRITAAARAVSRRRTLPPASSAGTEARSAHARADGALPDEVLEEVAPNVAGIHISDILRLSNNNIRRGNIRIVADVPDARLLFLPGGVPPAPPPPPLPLNVHVDRITAAVLRRLGGLPMDNKVLACFSASLCAFDSKKRSNLIGI